ncbi:hypothetical protein BgiMline_036568, partial [Biomphalaria glabrata]
DVRNFNNEGNSSKFWHKNHEEYFKSMKSYKQSSIAEICQIHDLIELIDVANPLTVKITSIFTSEERNTKKPLDSRPYAYDVEDGDREASGVILAIEDGDGGTFKVIIATAMHVVFNQNEARETSCYLYYDGEDSETVKLGGTVENVKTDINKDWCVFACKIDANACIKLKENLVKYKKELSKKISKRNAIVREEDRKVLLISHPHGCYKCVSMGDLRIKQNGYYQYTTPTCDGSSGGYLVIVGFSTTSLLIHSGYFPNDENKDGYSSGKITLNEIKC